MSTLTWTYPTTRTDGSPLAPDDIVYVTLLDSVNPNTPLAVVFSNTATGSTGSFRVGPLGLGTHNFTAIVRDTSNHDSAVSNVVVVVVTNAPPAAITDLAYEP